MIRYGWHDSVLTSLFLDQNQVNLLFRQRLRPKNCCWMIIESHSCSHRNILTKKIFFWGVEQLPVFAQAVIFCRLADKHASPWELSLTPKSISVLTAVCAASSEQLSVKYCTKSHIYQKNRQIYNKKKVRTTDKSPEWCEWLHFQIENYEMDYFGIERFF